MVRSIYIFCLEWKKVGLIKFRIFDIVIGFKKNWVICYFYFEL